MIGPCRPINTQLGWGMSVDSTQRFVTVLIACVVLCALGNANQTISPPNHAQSEYHGTQVVNNKSVRSHPGVKRIQQEAEEKPDQGLQKLSENINIGDILIVIFTGVLAFYAFKTWSLSNKTTVRQLRAYISVLGGNATLDGNILDASVGIKNFGQTPAYKVRMVMRIEVGVFQTPLEFPINVDQIIGSVALLGPGCDVSCQASVEITAALLTQISEKQATIKAWGIVNYEDAFEEKRFHIFRFSMNGPLSNIHIGNETRVGWALVADPQGHEAD